MIDSAIPDHLTETRTLPPRHAPDYQPPYPSFVARHRPAVTAVAMAYLGIQFRPEDEGAALLALHAIAHALAGDDAPGHWDRGRCVDKHGFVNIVTIAYWNDRTTFDRWFSTNAEAWIAGDTAAGRFGFFLEVLKPHVERYETLFSSVDRTEGVAAIADGMSGMIREHAYWGGMRDRIPRSQTDRMQAIGQPGRIEHGDRYRIIPHENLCLIRSGQDWSDTEGDERRMYRDDVEPVLRAGMEFLRDDGISVGCFDSRYMRVIDAAGDMLEKSFAMSWWTGLDALERWAETHPTHVAIFGAAMKYLMTVGPAARLRLYHEVTVAKASEQFFEYRNCHPGTGMLRAF